MEHEVFVMVPAERLGEALADPARVARAIPGLQQDVGADAEVVAGRLKVRVAGHTITYRGTLRVARQGQGAYAVQAEASEARGTGTVKLSLSVRLLPAEGGGTTVAFTGTAAGDGRIAELPEDAVASAGTRLLGRFAEGLGSGEAETGAQAAVDTSPGTRSETEPAGADDLTGAGEPIGDGEATAGGEPDDEDLLAAEDESDDDYLAGGFAGEEETSPVPASLDGDPHAEAAHARRTMIGRSAEEVDHAPPRGRYAPVPAPETVTATETLRWAAPAAALIVASAIVAGRMLRRRR